MQQKINQAVSEYVFELVSEVINEDPERKRCKFGFVHNNDAKTKFPVYRGMWVLTTTLDRDRVVFHPLANVANLKPPIKPILDDEKELKNQINAWLDAYDKQLGFTP